MPSCRAWPCVWIAAPTPSSCGHDPDRACAQQTAQQRSEAYASRRTRPLVDRLLKKSTIQVRVTDNGEGIDANQLPHLFDWFFRGDSARGRDAAGVPGIGLTIARALVEAHGGRLTALSAGLGTGATFTLSLPGAVGGRRALGAPTPIVRSTRDPTRRTGLK